MENDKLIIYHSASHVVPPATRMKVYDFLSKYFSIRSYTKFEGNDSMEDADKVFLIVPDSESQPLPRGQQREVVKEIRLSAGVYEDYKRAKELGKPIYILFVGKGSFPNSYVVACVNTAKVVEVEFNPDPHRHVASLIPYDKVYGFPLKYMRDMVDLEDVFRQFTKDSVEDACNHLSSFSYANPESSMSDGKPGLDTITETVGYRTVVIGKNKRKLLLLL